MSSADEVLVDHPRRGRGIAFPTTEEREAYEPGHRLKLAKLAKAIA